MRRQRGFSALEIIVAVVIVGMLSVALLGSYTAWVDQSSKDETRLRLRLLKNAFTEGYRRELLTVSAAGGPPAVTFGGVAMTSGADASAALLAPLQPYGSLSAGVLARDGFGRPMRIFVSNELNQVVAGTTLFYRIIALVAPGRNGVVNSVWDPATGTLTLAADDAAEIVNGYAAVREVYDDTTERLGRLAATYQNYFLTRYLANPARTISTNYFANTDPAGGASPNWDTTGGVASSRGIAVVATAVNLDAALGLAPADVNTAFGQPILVDNSSDAVNQPNNTTATRQLPPYTARVIAPLPGGAQLIRTVAGIYN
jgi:prepilin-type N-terminal cleavage/methylation domain-containing protein